MALIGSIERGSLHDGPGIRSVVFFKGCPLRCVWCHNPEYILPRPEVVFYRTRCIRCGDCEVGCPEGATRLEIPNRVDRTRCTGCGLCARECPPRALELVGENHEVDGLVEILLRDRLFYEASGGGVTLSGGEPTAQMDFLEHLLKGLKEEGIHTAIETNGFFDWHNFERQAINHLDLLLFDLKLADCREHRRLTGAGNETILANLTRVVERRPMDVIVRIPLIPGATATEENLIALSEILRKIGVQRCALLPYHPFGLEKVETIGRTPDAALPQTSMDAAEVAGWQCFFSWAELVEF